VRSGGPSLATPAAGPGPARPRALAMGVSREYAGLLASHLDLAFIETPSDGSALALDAPVEVVLVDGGLEPGDVARWVRSLGGSDGPPPVVVLGTQRQRSDFLVRLRGCGRDLVALDSEASELPARVETALERRRLERSLVRRESELERVRKRLAKIRIPKIVPRTNTGSARPRASSTCRMPAIVTCAVPVAPGGASIKEMVTASAASSSRITKKR